MDGRPVADLKAFRMLLRTSPRRPIIVSLVSVLAGTLLLAAPATAADPPPPPQPSVSFRTPPEVPARYVGQVSCEASAKTGTLALRDLILDTYGPSTIGTLRACSSGGRSEHKDGRSLDWMRNVSNPEQKAMADAFVAWLTGRDAQGVQAGNAHRLGVMYVIWNRRTWQSWTGTWKDYTGPVPHTDHVHVSLSWDGAMSRTSWWTGTAATPYDYGPCQVYVGEPAPRYSTPRYTPCPRPVPRPATSFPRLWDADLMADIVAFRDSGELYLYAGKGEATFRPADLFGRGWDAMAAVTAVGDVDGDGSRDLVATDQAGGLFLYRGDGRGGALAGRTTIGRGWTVMDAVLGVGDLDADGALDLLARRSSDGAALLFRGARDGTFYGGRVVGSLGSGALVSAVGDWDGDDRPDVMTTDADGRLLLHSGTADGGLAAGRQVGRGWDVMASLVGTGDVSGDGLPDVLAVRSDGSLWLYRGTGDGGWYPGARQVGRGWSTMTLVG